MTLESLLNCARPLYLETEIEGFDYGQVGSCFLVRNSNLLWVVTARHCLWPNQQPKLAEIGGVIERLWVPQVLADANPTCFGLTQARVALSATHVAASDIVVIDVANEPPPETADFCDLASFPLCTPRSGDKLVIAGYPKIVNEIQYPQANGGRLKPKRLLASGSFLPEATAPALHAMLLDKPDTLASYNGMSGSPVFRVRTLGGQTLAELAGLAVREMTSTGTIDFIPSCVLERVLGDPGEQIRGGR
jgi:hypothetical protein